MCIAWQRDSPVKAAKLRRRWRRWRRRCVEVKAFPPGRKKKSSTSPGNQSQILPPVCVRYGPRHASHPWLILSLHPRGHAHSAPPACTFFAGSDGGLMACSLRAAINLFIGHLPASWRRISRSRTMRALDWCVRASYEFPCEKHQRL